jgi:hypothetical protein
MIRIHIIQFASMSGKRVFARGAPQWPAPVADALGVQVIEHLKEGLDHIEGHVSLCVPAATCSTLHTSTLWKGGVHAHTSAVCLCHGMMGKYQSVEQLL